MKKNQPKRAMDENFFKEMNYELAGDIGAIDNEDMVNNRKLKSNQTEKNNEKEKEKIKNRVKIPDSCD
ncbi:hypothetical protein Amet_0536 [Alkaliphilus metalliredigens QYMF]|uniref:Uncharacterized protein n=1 Tax=Alkaliphilus metalliredigens (strain QYMF) TaxID=293826 RepID=A6TKP5_ALKMQ|nr:hypothetical protein Amet_0536 [Alkaliphilus metalliredigens QYMF]